MSKSQEYILWIGIFLLLVYLFTDVSVRDLIFNRKQPASTKPADQVDAFLKSIGNLPSSTGNSQTNNPNTGTVTLA